MAATCGAGGGGGTSRRRGGENKRDGERWETHEELENIGSLALLHVLEMNRPLVMSHWASIPLQDQHTLNFKCTKKQKHTVWGKQLFCDVTKGTSCLVRTLPAS